MKGDWKDRIRKIREQNNDAAWAIYEFLENMPTAINPEMITEANPENRLPEEALYAAFMAGFSGVPEDDRIISDYFRDSVKCLSIEEFKQNEYIRSIDFPDIASNEWAFTHYAYRPYEAFIRDDIKTDSEFREIPQIGYFKERVIYPAVEQNHREWMAVKPSEIATMQPAIDSVSGRVAVFGLGLGYFAFMASLKQSVSTVDIIEIDHEVIQLFKRYILPQISEKQKIRIVEGDAFDYLERGMRSRSTDCYDFAFIDLWHDTSDGLELYLKARKTEHNLKTEGCWTCFLYWVEKSLLSAYRWKLFDKLLSVAKDEDEAAYLLSDNNIRKIAGLT